jgi:REP element-mobilizing transposase RayT
MTLFKNKYRIEPARLIGFDYGSNAAYFITICTKNRINYFGKIVETDNHPSYNETHNSASLQNTPIAKIAEQFWNEIPKHYPFVILDEFIIMPNHIHGILIINKEDVKMDNRSSDFVKTHNCVETHNCASLPEWNENKFGPQSQNIPAIIRSFKSSVKRFANENQIEFEWQPRYYDRIIRDEEEMQRIRIYINQNIENWRDDENYSP